MPRYVFHVKRDVVTVLDQEGVEFANAESSAPKQAIASHDIPPAWDPSKRCRASRQRELVAFSGGGARAGDRRAQQGSFGVNWSERALVLWRSFNACKSYPQSLNVSSRNR